MTKDPEFIIDYGNSKTPQGIVDWVTKRFGQELKDDNPLLEDI